MWRDITRKEGFLLYTSVLYCAWNPRMREVGNAFTTHKCVYTVYVYGTCAKRNGKGDGIRETNGTHCSSGTCSARSGVARTCVTVDHRRED